MRFVLYTEKTVAQCMSALNDRMQLKGTRSRPELDGWIEKGGDFSIATSSTIARRFTRKTRLEGSVKRDKGITIVQGVVSDGADRRGQMVIFVALVIVGIMLLNQGNALLAITAILAGVTLYIPLAGDHNNSAVLLKELRATLKAKDTPPKK